jgi:hypothetical protein
MAISYGAPSVHLDLLMNQIQRFYGMQQQAESLNARRAMQGNQIAAGAFGQGFDAVNRMLAQQSEQRHAADMLNQNYRLQQQGAEDRFAREQGYDTYGDYAAARDAAGGPVDFQLERAGRMAEFERQQSALDARSQIETAGQYNLTPSGYRPTMEEQIRAEQQAQLDQIAMKTAGMPWAEVEQRASMNGMSPQDYLMAAGGKHPDYILDYTPSDKAEMTALRQRMQNLNRSDEVAPEDKRANMADLASQLARFSKVPLPKPQEPTIDELIHAWKDPDGNWYPVVIDDGEKPTPHGHAWLRQDSTRSSLVVRTPTRSTLKVGR